jgi:Tol biopolymer transport system component
LEPLEAEAMKTKSFFKELTSSGKNAFAKISIGWIFAILFFSGCEQIPNTIPNPPQDSATAFSPTVSVTATLTPTRTESANTPSHVPGRMTEQCLVTRTALLTDVDSIKGLIASDLKGGTAFFWNENADRTYFPVSPGGRIHDIKVSPDHKNALYWEVSNQSRDWTAKIIDNSLKIVYSRTSRFGNLFGWFDGQRLWHFWPGQSSSSQAQLNLINPFTGDQQELRLDLPFKLQDSQLINPTRWRAPGYVYSPDLSRVVYPACDDRCPQFGNPVLLYSIQTDEILARLNTLGGDNGTTPIWLSDSSRFIMTADIYSEEGKSYEFFSISRDGKITQLTHLHDYYGSAEISEFYTISPDDHYLAFWVKVPARLQEDPKLAILNLDNGEITNYCISGFPYNNDFYVDNYHFPIWSPDGTQLAIMSHNLQTPDSSRVAIIDLVHNTATQVVGMDNVEPVGWLLIP